MGQPTIFITSYEVGGDVFGNPVDTGEEHLFLLCLDSYDSALTDLVQNVFGDKPFKLHELDPAMGKREVKEIGGGA